MTERKDGPSTAVQLRAMKRDRFRCNYCGVAGTEAELQIDHIIPVARGGSHHISNLTTACRQCNQSKGTKSMKPSIEADRIRPVSLIGLFLHTFGENGLLDRQGEIIGMDGDQILVQTFSWVNGDPYNIEPFTRDFIYSRRCVLYQTEKAWSRASLKIQWRQEVQAGRLTLQEMAAMERSAFRDDC